MEKFATANVETGKLNALVKNIMAQMGIEDSNEAVRRVNSGEWIVSQSARRWREENSVIYFSVTSDGTTGSQWIERFEGKKFRVGKYAKSVLLTKDFKPTNGVTYQIAVLKGTLFTDDDRITEKIRAEANHRKLEKPNAEVACLIREMFSNKELETMGLCWIVVFHKPIKDSDGDPSLLSAHRVREGCWLDTCCDKPGGHWPSVNGFAFVLSQVSSQ